jgi:hypothetical protein
MTTPRLEALEAIEAAVWQELGQAVRNKAHAWRLCVLATRDGEEADARSVVLREWNEATRTLLIFTDARSPKAHQIAAHPAGTLVMWSPELTWQLRLRVQLSLETSGLAVSSRWARLKLTPARFDYLSPLPPGSRLDAPGSRLDAPGSLLDTPGSLLDKPASPLGSPDLQHHAADPPRESREHFAVIAAQVVAVDWLELHALGHRRALFDHAGRRWLTP